MDLQEELRGFKFGVQSAMETDNTPLESTPFAWNTAFRSIGSGSATLGTRPGLKIVNSTPLTSNPSFFLIKNYPYNSSGITNKLALVTSIGRLYFKDMLNAIGSEITPPANFPYTVGRCFANGDYAVDAAIMNNRLLMVNTNGERRSVLNETFTSFGLAPLAVVAATNVATGTSSMPAETYDVSVTTYDSATGAESSSGASVSVTLGANERIRVTATISAAETARNTHWRVYLRRQTTQSNRFRVLELEDLGGGLIVVDGNIPIATSQVYIDLTAAKIAQHILVAPSLTENNEPPVSARYIATFGGRLILADLQNFYWSKLGLPDAFPPNNQDNLETGEGDEIRGLHEFSDDLFLIFTANNVWGIFGNDPQSWIVKAVDKNVGCASHRSIVKVPGGVMWWSATQGPVLFDGQQTQKVGLDKLGIETCVNEVEGERTEYIASGFDPHGQRALFSYPLENLTRNTAILPFNARVGEFEASRWNPMDMSCFGTGYDIDEKLKLFCGNYGGQLFVLDVDTLNDGVPSGTVSGTFTPLTGTPNTIESTGFLTTGAGLAERYVIVKNSTGQIVGRERIVSNTGTVLTLAANLGLVSGELHSFDVGGQDWRLFTKHIDFGQAFRKKRVDNVYVHIRSASDTEKLLLSTFINYGMLQGTTYQGWANSGDTFDSESAIFDTTVWGGSGGAKRRFRVVRNSHAIQVALFHSQANKDFVLLKIGALARQLSDRNYG